MRARRKYSPNYVNDYSDIAYQLPDNYYIGKEAARPKDNFVVAKNRLGDIVSYYGDDTWDFRHYAHTGDSRRLILYFSKLKGMQKKEAKWLVFLLIYVYEPKQSAALTLATIKTYKNSVSQLAKYAHKKNKSLLFILSDEDSLIQYLSQIKTRGHLSSISVLISHFSSIPREVSGFDIEASNLKKYFKKFATALGELKQYPVIPQRIFSGLITELTELMEDVFECKELILKFINELIVNKRFGRSKGAQWMRGYIQSEFEPGFIEAADMYGLSTLFYKYDIENIPSFRGFLTKVQHGCQVLIIIYSGMRNGEALSLTVNSLQKTETISHTSFKLVGHTSKLVGQKKLVSWVTSKDIVKAYDIAKPLAELAGELIDLKNQDIPLFISLSYLSFDNNIKYDGGNIAINSHPGKNVEVYKLLDQTKFVISENDIRDLEKIDPFRAWETELAFASGSIWRFTSHQFRRSLAFYVAQSALVSLPSLKRQMKHIDPEMSLYYCHSFAAHEEYNGENHISKFINKVKPTADAAAYLYDILLSDEKLFGVHGKFVEANTKLVSENDIFGDVRKNLEARFKKGEIAYSVTHLGGCITIEPCYKKALRIISVCVGCENATIKQSNLTNVIDKQDIFVNKLKSLNPESIAYRTELEELKALKNFKSRVVDGNAK